jgi:hypothetical protein
MYYYVRHEQNEYERWEISFIAPICDNKKDGQFLQSLVMLGLEIL